MPAADDPGRDDIAAADWDPDVPLLVITGPPGAGKTTVASLVSDRLQEAAMPHAMVDLDALGWRYPRPDDDPFHAALRLTNLATLWRNQRAAGARRLVVATVVETPDDVARIARAVGSSDTTLVRLRAESGEVARRLGLRENGPALEWHVARAVEVGTAMDGADWLPRAVETTGRDPADIATDVLAVAGWLRPAHRHDVEIPDLATVRPGSVPVRSAVVDVLLISGPAGVGKTSVAFEVSLQLQRRDVPHALLDTDELDRLYPAPEDQEALNLENLTAVWDGFARRGCLRLILAGVWLHRPSELAWIARAVPGARFISVVLTASVATICERVGRREVGTAGDEQLERSLRHARSMDDADGTVRLATDGTTVEALAQRIIELWSLT